MTGLSTRRIQNPPTLAMNEENILKSVLTWVQEARLLSGQCDPDRQKIVEFVRPSELPLALGGLAIGRDPPGDEAVLRIVENVIRYSVKTCHPRFFNQVIHCHSFAL